MKKYNLIESVDGNAHSIIGYVCEAMKAEGKAKGEIEDYTNQATTFGYSTLIRVSVSMIDELNAKYDD